MNEMQHLVIIQSRLEKIENLLKKRQEDDIYMTIIEASEFTRLSTATLRRAIYSGDLPFTRGNGTKIIFKKSSLTKWMES